MPEEYDDKLKELLATEDLKESPKKICDSCDQSLPMHSDYFQRDKHKEDGFRSVCSSCREAQRQHALTNKKVGDIERFEEKIANFMGSVSLEFEPGISRKENVGDLYEAILNSFGGVKNIGALYAIVFAKGSEKVQLRLLELMSRMSTKVTELGLADQSYEDMTQDELLAEIERKSRAAKMPAVAAAIMESLQNQNKAIEVHKSNAIEIESEVKNEG